MSPRMIKFLFILFLFFFGLLFGLEIGDHERNYDDGRDMFIDPSRYITRIENGQFVFEPIHEPNDQSNMSVDTMVTEEQIEDSKTTGPKMKKEGRMDQLGQRFGQKLSEITRTTLEISFGLIVD